MAYASPRKFSTRQSVCGTWPLKQQPIVYLKALFNLETLTLNSTQFTDVGLGHLQGLSNLKTRELSNTQLIDAGVAELKKALPNCSIAN